MFIEVVINNKKVVYDEEDFELVNIENFGDNNSYLHYKGNNIKPLNPVDNISCFLMFTDLNITSLDFSKFDSSKVTSMSGMFWDCKFLEEICLKDFKTNSVEDMFYMFKSCKSLKKIDLKEFNTENVRNMRGMFNGCSSLKELDLSVFNTCSVENLWEFVRNCSSLERINLSNFNTSKVDVMISMFEGCSSLKKLDLTSFDFTQEPKVENMFKNCNCIVYVKDEWSRDYLVKNTGYKNIVVKNFNDKYRIIESFSQGKNILQEKNEDQIYFDEHYIAVIDGVTDKTENNKEKTGGKIAGDIIIASLSNFNGGENFTTVVKEIQKNLYDYNKKNPVEYLSASAVIYSVDRKEIWSIGDCQFSIDGKVKSNKNFIDSVYSQMRSIAITALLEEGYTEEDILKQDKAREYLLPFLRLQKNLENKNNPYGYCVFNGSCSPDNFPIEKVTILSVERNTEIIFASDGYPLLKKNLEESEKYLEKIIEKDPLCYREYLSTKGLKEGFYSFDDRTYVRFYVF